MQHRISDTLGITLKALAVRLMVDLFVPVDPAVIIGMVNGKEEDGAAGVDDELRVNKLGVGYLKIKIRARVTEDEEKSVLAN